MTNAKMTEKTAAVLADYAHTAGDYINTYDLSKSEKYHFEKLVKLGYAAKVKVPGFKYKMYIIHLVQVAV